MLRLPPDPQTAQDVLQEVFVTAFRKADDVPRPPIGWLFGTARWLFANKHRGNRRYDGLIARLLDDVIQEADAAVAEVKEAFGHGYRGDTPAGQLVEALHG